MSNNQQRELLAKLRGRLAYKSNCAPYLIFSDELMEELLSVKPKTLDELSTIKGFPRDGKRVTKWGPAIVDVFCEKEVADFEVTQDSEGDLVVRSVITPMSIF
jgi:ribonuclease D